MEEKIIQLLSDFSKKYNINYNDNAFHEFEIESYTNIAFFIDELFPVSATGFLFEQGTVPSEYYPSLILSLANTTNNEFAPEKISITSVNNWDTAKVNFSIGDQIFCIEIDDVNNSDWVSTSFIHAMNDFAKKTLIGKWIEFYGEDWCTCLYLPENAVDDFNKIRKSKLTFGIDKVTELCRIGDPDYALAEILISLEDINSVDSNGDLALNVAIRSGFTDRLWVLSEQGSPCLNPNAKDKRGQSSFDIAVELGLEDVLNQLKDYEETYTWWLENQK